MMRSFILAIYIFTVLFNALGQNSGPIGQYKLPVLKINAPDDSIRHILFEALYHKDIFFHSNEGQFAYSQIDDFEFRRISVGSLSPHFSTNFMNGIEIYSEEGFNNIFRYRPQCKTLEIFAANKATPFFTRLYIMNMLGEKLPGPPLNNSELAILYINDTYAGPVLVQEGQDDFMQNFYPRKESGIISFYSDIEKNEIPEDYKELLSFFSFNELNSDINFRTAKQMIDLDIFNKLLFLSLYSAHNEWENNVNIFKADEENLAWRFAPCSLQKGLALDEDSAPDLNLLANYISNSQKESNGSLGFFNELLQNEAYFHETLSGFYTDCSIYFDTTVILPVFDSLSEEILAEYKIFLSHKDDFPISVDSLYFASSGEFEADLTNIRGFLSQRAKYMKEHILQIMGEKAVTFKLINADMDSGSIFIQNSVLEDSVYINDFAPGSKINLQAQGNDSFYFSHWSGMPSKYSTKPSIELEFSEGLTVTPVFESIPEVVINEIHYNAKEGKQYDYLELFNPQDVPSDISQYYFESGFLDFTFPKNTIIEPKGYLIIAKDTSKYSPCNCKLFQLEYDGLSDFGELFRLNRKDNTTVDEVEYFTTPPWPSEAYGQGPSLELSSFYTDNSFAENWKASSNDGGTPGYANSKKSYSGIIINEIALENKNDIYDEYYEYDTWVELKNISEGKLDIEGLYLSNRGGELNMFQVKSQSSPRQNTIVDPDEYIILWADSNSAQGNLHLNFHLKSNDTLYLSNGRDQVFDKMIIAGDVDLASVGHYPDGEGGLFSFYDATPGVKNSIAPVILSEPIDTVTEFSTWSYLFETSDKDNDPIQIQYWQVPTWINYGESGANVLFSGTPDSVWRGVNNLKLSVTDGYSRPVIHEFSIEVLKFIAPIDSIPGTDTVPPVDTIPDIDTLPGTDTLPDSLPDNIHSKTSGPLIAPSVVGDFFIIEKSGSNNGFALYIYDIKGILRKQKYVNPGLSKYVVNVSDLNTGLYIIAMQSQNEIYKQKIVIFRK